MAIGIVVSGFIVLLVLGLTRFDHFDTLLVFISTLIGSITGFYFGGERARAATSTESSKTPKSNKDRKKPKRDK